MCMSFVSTTSTLNALEILMPCLVSTVSTYIAFDAMVEKP